MRLNSALWLIKISTGIILIPAILIHLNVVHFHSGNLILPENTLYFLILALLSLHIAVALRDILIEVEMRRSIIYLVLLFIFLALLFPTATGGNRLESLANTTPQNGSCIKESDWMLYNHGYLLKKWRDEAVRNGDRFHPVYGKKDFTTCYTCHSYKDFCLNCHQKIGVKPDCFSCHVAQEKLKENQKGG